MTNTSKGFHTFSIFRKLSVSEYKALCKDFQNYMKNNKNFKCCNHNEYGWEWFYVKNKGIRWRLSSNIESNGYVLRKIEAIINPQSLLHNNYISAATESDLFRTEEVFNEETENISDKLLSFSDYSLNRADYCMNIDLAELDYPCTPQQMMKLIKQGDIPEFFQEYKTYSETGHRYIDDKNSFYLTNSSATFNCYLKYFQQTEQHPNYFNRSASENVIRFEVQCKRKKLYEMFCTQYNSDADDNFDRKGIIPINSMLRNKFSEIVVNNYLEKILRKGHYFTFDGATEIIKSYKFKEEKEDRLLDTLELIKEHGGIAKTKVHLLSISTKNEYEKKLRDFNRTLRDFDDLLINPITIPRRWKIKWIPNVMFAYDCANCDELFLNAKEHKAMERIHNFLYKNKMV